MKQIKDYPNYYITKCGKVWSEKSKKFLKIQPDKDGYPVIALWNNGKPKKFKVHRLVAIHYIIGNNSLQVNHINGIKTDNRIDNLEWCTLQENIDHANRTGLSNIKSERNHKSKKVIDVITGMVFNTITEASVFIGMSRSHLTDCLNGKLNNFTNLKKII